MIETFLLSIVRELDEGVMDKKAKLPIILALISLVGYIATPLITGMFNKGQPRVANNLNMHNSPGAVQINGGNNYFSVDSQGAEISGRNKGIADLHYEFLKRSDFYNRDYGAVAIMLNARTQLKALQADTCLVLKPNKQSWIETGGQSVWLQVNHYLAETNGKRRHFGVFIVTFGRTGATMPLEVFRNKKWVRPGNGTALGEFSEVVDLSWKDYLKMIEQVSSTQGSLSDSDNAVKGSWHAIPQGGKEFSWDYRKFWKWAAEVCQKTSKNIVGPNPDFDNVKVSARLISYSPVGRPQSKSPVLFDIRTLDQKGVSAFIAIYALKDDGQDVREWYWVSRAD